MPYLLIIFLFVFANVNAEILTYRNVDSLTYSQFAKKQYKELRITGNTALKKKIDFYELRMRLGIMYFDCENYQKSSKHLGKAYSMNPTDSTIYEYLYFSYLFSGREAQANEFIYSIKKSVGNRIKSKKNLDYVIEINSGIVTNKQSESEFTNYKGSENIYAETNLNTQAIFNSLIFKKSFNNKVDLYAGYSDVRNNVSGVVQTSDTSILNKFQDKSINYQFTSSFRLDKEIVATLFFGYNDIKFERPQVKFDSIIGSYSFENFIRNKDYFLIGFGFSKKFTLFNLELNYTNSNFGNNIQNQGEFNLVYYPFGNSKLYSISKLAFVSQGDVKNVIYNQSVGLKINNWFYLEGKYSLGDQLNYSTNYGFLVYNTSDPIQTSGSLATKFYWKNLEICPTYIIDERMGSTFRYVTFTTTELSNYKYLNHTFLTSLKWKF